MFHVPLFSESTFLEQLQSLSLDDQGLWRPLEIVLFPHTPVVIKEELNANTCLVETPAYPHAEPLYTDKRLLSVPLPWTPPQLPSLSHFLERIYFCLEHKVPYLWGGNLPEGCASLTSILNGLNINTFEERIRRVYNLKGVDCSGLIYWATGGATQRNTSALIREGQGVSIAGCSAKTLAAELKPGMLLAWKGHVLIYTEKGIIESSPDKGVHCTPTEEKLQALMHERLAIDEWPENPTTPSFVVRELFP